MKTMVLRMVRFAEMLGRQLIDIVKYAGGISILMGQTLFWIPIPPYRRRQIVEHERRRQNQPPGI